MDKLKIVGQSKEDILRQINAEYELSVNYVRQKRVDFRERLKLYNNQRKQKEKVGILTIYTTINTLISVYYTDQLEVEFAGREIADSYLSDNINNTAKFDYDEMDMERINYFVQFDRFFFGVGIRDVSTYDTDTNTPIANSISPLSWLPDPRGGLDPMGGNGGFRFYGFEVDRAKAEMKRMGFFNLDKLSAAQRDTEQEQTRIAQDEAYGLQNQFRTTGQNYSHADYSQLDWYTILTNESGGESKYLVTTNADRTEIFRIEKFSPVTDAEKANESLVPWPIALNYYSPQRENPFGTSVCDLVEDKQRAKSVLANLRIAKEKAAMYPMYMYNSRMVRNRRDMDFGFNKSIPINVGRGENLENAVAVFPKDRNDPMTFNQEQSLEHEAQASTGADQMQQGVLSDQDRTLGEVQQVTANAQVRFLLGTRINSWGDKQFWGLWYRSYRQYFSKTQKKLIRMRGGIGVRFSTITRKDFITKQDPDIYIGSKIELAHKRESKRLAFVQVVPMLLQDPTNPAASTRFIKREMLRLNNIPSDMIAVMIPETPDETDACQENELLTHGDMVKIHDYDDHLSHLVIHAQSEDTPEKFAHMEAHRQAYMVSEQRQKDMEARAAMATSSNLNGQVNQSQSQVGQQAASGAGIKVQQLPTQTNA